MKAQLRDVFREAFDRLGGADWLVEFAQENDGNARVFVQAVTKLIPISAKLDVNPNQEDLTLLTTAQLRSILLQQLSYIPPDDANVVTIEQVDSDEESV
jgi:hypothetical protein